MENSQNTDERAYIHQTKFTIYPTNKGLKRKLVVLMVKNRIGGTIHKILDDGNKTFVVDVEAPDTNIWNFLYEFQRFYPPSFIHGGDIVKTTKEFKLEKFTVTIIRTKKEDQSQDSSGQKHR